MFSLCFSFKEKYMFWLIMLIITIFILWFIIKKVKFIKVGTINMITGGVKTGKSMLTVHLAVKEYRKVLRQWKVRVTLLKAINLFRKNKVSMPEKPILYSNTPLRIECYKITKDLLLRKTRAPYKSVFYFDEAALVSDSMDFKDKYRNECIDLFNKLFGHATRGGTLFYDTQNIADNHKGIRRNIATYINIIRTIKIPFFVLMHTREQTYDETGNTINVNTDDIDTTGKFVIIPKKVWKLYDRYCYAFLTDNLSKDTWKRDDKLGDPFKIVSFRDFITLKEEDVE